MSVRTRLGRAASVALAALLAWAAWPTTAAAQEGGPSETPPGTWHHGAALAYDEGLLDRFGFPRRRLSKHGLDLHLSTLSIWQRIVEGGVEQRGVFSTSYDVQAYLDMCKLGLWPGGYGVVRVEGKTDDNGVNPFTGAIIPVNVDAAVPVPEGTAIELTEIFYAHDLGGGRAEILVGMWNIGRFFDVSPFSGPYPFRFLNSHMFFNSTLIPYAPYNKLGGVLTLKPVKEVTITTGVADANSSVDNVDWFRSGEINLLHEWRFATRPCGLPGIVTFGFAYTNAEQPTNADATVTRQYDGALYANFSQWLHQCACDPKRGVGVFGRLGITDGKVNTIQRHASAGVVFDGMVPCRPRDSAGIVAWHNAFSDDIPGDVSRSSSGFEAYYRFEVTPWFQVSADLQVLFGPGTDPTIDDTVVVGLRALVLF